MEKASPAAPADSRIFVAVGMEVNECSKTVEWAAKNAAMLGGKRIVLLHVFQPIQSRWHSTLDHMALAEEQKKDIDKALRKYMAICSREMVETDKLAIAEYNIGRGILKQVSELRIRKLVMGAAANIHRPRNSECPLLISKLMMGAAADIHDARNMSMPHSRKANIVCKNAHHSCHIWFVCNGQLVYIRESRPLSRVEGDRISRSPLQSDIPSINHEGSISPPVNGAFGSTQNEQKIKRLLGLSPTYEQLQKAKEEAEKDAAQAARKAIAEAPYAKEMKLRREIEEQLESLRIEQLRLIEELQQRKEIGQLESLRIEQLRIIEEHQQKFSAAKERLVIVQRERDELLREREDAVTEVEEMHWQRSQEEAASSSQGPLAFSEYMLSELEEATNRFDEKMKIGAGGFGIVYKCRLRQTLVAVKTLHHGAMHGCSEIQREVDVLSKVMHPNLVALIGTCPDHPALVYEYLPNGSLKDWLHRKYDTPSLSWQIRTRIAFEICSALIFLHSRKPESIVHGDLKPDNILLDSNFFSKLGDFGICRLILRGEDSKATVHLLTGVKGTVG